MKAQASAVRERPIPFSGAMVRAILNTQPGVWPAAPIDPARPCKWQTRQVVRPTMTAPRVAPLRMEPWLIDGVQQWHETLYLPMWAGFHPDYPGEAKWFTCPYGKPGDRLWVRERWRIGSVDRNTVWYEDGSFMALPHSADELAGRDLGDSWHSARFMFRWAARLLFDVMGVRVEQVQGISEDDIHAEGFDRVRYRGYTKRTIDDPEDFSDAWDAINGKYAPWKSDPWVWVVEFKRLT